MSTQQFDARRSLSRRRLLVLTGVALGTGGLLAACQAAAPAAPPAGAPATAAPGTTGASPLKGTKLTIIGGNSYVPAQDGLIDNMVKQLSADTGMDAKIERFADAQMDAKVAAVIESGGADVAVLRDTDPHLYANKLLDVTDVAMELDTSLGRMVRRRQAVWHRRRQVEGAHARPGARGVELAARLLQGGRRRQVPGHLRRAQGCRAEDADLWQTDRHVTRARAW